MSGVVKAVASILSFALPGIGGILFGIVSNLVLGLIGTALFGKPKKPKPAGSQGSGITTTVRSAEEPRRIIIGERVVGGALAFAATGAVSGDTIRDLHLVLALCEGEVAELSDVYFDAILSSDAQFIANGSGSFALSKHVGTDDQAADAALVAAMPTQWTTAHRLRGVAYLYAKLVWANSPLVWSTGIPNITVRVRGRLIEDPRVSLTRYTRNPALAVRFYLLLSASRGGFGEAADNIDEASFAAAANACDEVVSIAGDAQAVSSVSAADDTITLSGNAHAFALGDRVQVSVASGGTIPAGLAPTTDYWWTTTSGRDPNKPVTGKLSASYADALAGTYIDITSAGSGTLTLTRNGQVRYTCDAVLQLDRPPAEIIEDLLSSMAGQLVFAQGTWRCFAGVARAASGTLTVGDLRGPVVVQPRVTRRELFNAVRGTIPDATRFDQDTSFPPVVNDTYAAQDGGAQIFRDIELPCTTSPLRAQRIAKIHLERARQAITVRAPLNWSGLAHACGDILEVTDAALGWTDKEFEVVEWSLAEGGGVDLMLQEYSGTVYDWNDGLATRIDPAPDTTLPTWSDVSEPGLALDDDFVTMSNGTLINRLLINVTLPADEFVIRYEVQYRPASETEWRPLPDNAVEVLGVEDDVEYDARVRAINTLGAQSDWVEASRTVVGQSEAPADVADFAVNILGDTAFLTWTANTDRDLSHYRVRFTPGLTETSWGNTIDIVPQVSRAATSVQVPAMVGTYMIKAVDFRGHESESPAVSVSTVAALTGLNVVETLAEQSGSPNWTGTKDDVVVVDDALRIGATGGTNWDDIGAEGSPTLTWDEIEGSWDTAGGPLEGIYTFGPIDLGAVYTSRLTAAMTVTGADLVNVWDDREGLWDETAGLWDGEVTSRTNVRLEVSTAGFGAAAEPTAGLWLLPFGPMRLAGAESAIEWGPWRPFIVGDYTARHLRFRAILSTEARHLTPVVSALSVSVDMPDRIDSARNLMSDPAGSAIVFSPAFRATPAIGITAFALQEGENFEITDESATGFTITFYAPGSPSVGVARRYDWFARGYGRETVV